MEIQQVTTWINGRIVRQYSLNGRYALVHVDGSVYGYESYDLYNKGRHSFVSLTKCSTFNANTLAIHWVKGN